MTTYRMDIVEATQLAVEWITSELKHVYFPTDIVAAKYAEMMTVLSDKPWEVKRVERDNPDGGWSRVYFVKPSL